MALTKVTSGGITDSAITSAKINDGAITNDDIKSDAAITAGKLSATLDLSSKTVTLPAASVTAHATNPTKASIEALGIDLPAANLTGTIADARFPSTLPAISGANLTGINAVVVGTTLPSPVSTEGSLFYKSDTDIFYISDGTQWNLVSNANPATTGGTVTIDALSEGGTFSYDLGLDFEDDVDTDAQLTYTLSSGTLPSGCTLPTTGNSAFTGTASVVSSNTNYTWTIKVTDTSGGTATQDYQQTINTVAPTVTGGTVTISSVNEGSSASYDVDTDFTFGTGSTFSAYSLQSGSLPSGTSLATATGVISGTAGNVFSNTAYTFTIRGTDTDGDTVDQSYSWTINTITPTSTGGTVTISNTSEGASASYDVDTNFSYPTGSTFSAYSLQSGSLPNGLSLNTTSGVISGTAGNSGSASFTIRATDTDGDVKDQAYSWVINNVVPTSTGGTVTISNTSEGASASYDVDTNFSYSTGSTFSAYSLASGTLPAGTSLNASTGVISGTAGNSGSYSFTIRATDTNGDTADQAYSWVINNVVPTSTGGTVTISSVREGLSASYDVDTNFTFTTGSAFSAYSLLSGSLPSGLSLNTSTGVISGTMGTVSSDTAYSFSIRGTDTNSDYVDQAYSWTITDTPFSATGGTITTYSGYKVHTFTSSGTFTANKSGSVNVLVVAGGGGGGSHVGGGGGAGGMLASNLSVSAQSLTVTVGSGGVGSYNNGGYSGMPNGANGGNSSFSSLTAIGGGRGQEWDHGSANNGGSGGGGSNTVWSPGVGTSGQGNNGGTGHGSSPYECGGGGGGGGAGVNWSTNKGGNGGIGKVNNYRTGANIYYAGGGGGGVHNGGTTPGTGGTGGGGNGKVATTTKAGSGSVNLGGGGGGTGNSGNAVSNGGNGGSGVVIIRYAV